MKRLFLILVVIFFLNSIYSQTCDAVDLASCDPSFFEDETALKEVNTDFLFSSINSEEVTNKDYLVAEVNRRILDKKDFSDFINLLNQDEEIYANVRNSWWKSFGYKSYDSKIADFDGKIVTTEGKDSTTFNINHFSGGVITETGCLQTKEFSSCGAILEKSASNSFSIDGGTIKVNPSSSNLNFKISKDSGLSFNGNTYSSDGEFSFRKVGTTAFVSGEGVVEKDLNDIITSEFSGNVEIYTDHIVFGKDTSYDKYVSGELSKTFQVKDLTSYYLESGKCSTRFSCIEDYGANLKINSVRENNILVQMSDDSVKNLKTELISDSSSIIFKDEMGHGFTFNKFTPRFTGNIFKFGVNIDSPFFNEKTQEVHQFKFEDGKISQCSAPCQEFSIKSLVQPNVDLFMLDKKAQQRFFKSFKEQYGIVDDNPKDPVLRPDYLKYIDYNQNSFYKSSLDASEKIYSQTGKWIAPEVIYMSAIAEGGDQLGTKCVRCQFIDGFVAIGYDRAGEADGISDSVAKGYLPDSFKDGEDYYRDTHIVINSNELISEHTNEQGKKVKSVIFSDLDSALWAKGAELVKRRDLFLSDAQAIGINVDSLSEDSKIFWNYVYYNYGIYGGKNMLKDYYKKGYLTDDNYVWRRPDLEYVQVHRNALLKTANLKMFQKVTGLIE